MLKVFSISLKSPKMQHFRLSIGTDFMDEVNRFKNEIMSTKRDFNRSDIEMDDFRCRSIPVEEIIEAAKLDLKELVRIAKLSDDANELSQKI
jgi:hypothetical protein